MDAPTAGHSKALSLGALVTEGKTKKIFRINGSDLVSVVAKDDITAGDGAKHDVIPDKGRLATATTCNVFRLLKACGLPIAFEEQDAPVIEAQQRIIDASDKEVDPLTLAIDVGPVRYKQVLKKLIGSEQAS